MRPVPQATIDLIKTFEGFSPIVYKCPAGYDTFGYGSLLKNYPTTEFPISKTQAEECIYHDLKRFAISIGKLITVSLNDNQYAALLDFTYNLGAATLQRSTLRTKLNRSEYNASAKELLRYVYGGGKILPGLVKRRQAEYNLFIRT